MFLKIAFVVSVQSAAFIERFYRLAAIGLTNSLKWLPLHILMLIRLVYGCIVIFLAGSWI